MAVYTSVKESEIKLFLKQYNLGSLVSYEGILEGIENTNYKINTNEGSFILTLFEKRVNPKDLPFFMSLQKHLSDNKFICPIPIQNKDNNIVNTLCNKKAIIISFLEGKKVEEIKSAHCLEVGEMISNFQNLTKNFILKRKNNLLVNDWKNIFVKCLKIKDHKFLNLTEVIKSELIFLEKNWPKNLPNGIIHADIFQDNVFFKNDTFSGLIDFYFSCNDFYAYELALTTNAWCFSKQNLFLNENFESLIKGYTKLSKITNEEIKNFNILLRGAAIRILVTRLHDQLFHPAGAIVKPKDPLEYFNILKWHQENKIL